MIKGFWNGEPAEITGIIYTVTKSEITPLHWQNSCVGEKRQGIKIFHKGASFMIDNEDGQGYLKVTEGRGSFTYGHKTVMDPLYVREIPDEEVKKVYDDEINKKQFSEHEKWAAKNYPQQYKKLVELRSSYANIKKDNESKK